MAALSKIAKKGIESAADFLKSFSDKVYYHFSTSDIKEFDPYPGYDAFGEFDYPGSKFKGRGVIYFTSDPKYANKIGEEIKGFEDEDFYNFDFSDKGMIDDRRLRRLDDLYFGSDDKMKVIRTGKAVHPSDYYLNPDEGFQSGDVIYPVKIKDKNIFDYKKKKDLKKLEKEVGSDSAFAVESGNFRALEDSEIKDALKKLGYSGYKTSEPGTVGMFYPEDIRSIFGKFDPKKASSGNILASGLVGYGAFGGLDGEYTK